MLEKKLRSIGREIFWRIKPHTMNQVEVLRSQGKTMPEIVEKYPMLDVKDLTRIAKRDLGANQNRSHAKFLNSPQGQLLVKQAVQGRINSLYPDFPKIAERLDNELNPDIK